MLSKDEALFLLRKYCSNSVLKHSLAVSNNAKKLAEKIKDNGYDIDVNFVEVAALLHDIGRSKTHGVKHGIVGAKIILEHSKDKKIARVCETHIGAGIAKDEAKAIGIPEKNYLPETLEEKIIAHADNITFGTETVSIEKVIEKLGEKLGKGHPALKRILELNDFIEKLLNEKIK